MNAVTFDIARYMGNFAFTNSNRFVEVELNGDYIGMYQLTEQIEQAKSRVDISSNGYLISLDADDGPDLSPLATDNFWSSVYELPVCVKYPKDANVTEVEAVSKDFEILERNIKNLNYDSVKILLDVPSFIDFLIIQEVTRNVELVTPRSMYMYKDGSLDKWHYGPVWDFDGGFAFDWASMSTGHNYFDSDSWLMGSSNPAKVQEAMQKNSWGNRGDVSGDAYNVLSGFFVGLFANEEFVLDYKARWNAIYTDLLTKALANMLEYENSCSKAMERNALRWPIDKKYTSEIRRL